MSGSFEEISVRPIGAVIGGRNEPRDDDWDVEVATIRLDKDQFGPEALAGLDAFSHVEVVFVFNRVDPAKVERGARYPRGNTDWPRVGIFAQRAKDRPNRLGVSVCRLLGVEGLEVRVAGLDAIDATPVLDLKPYMHGFAPRGVSFEPDWSRELMSGYWG